MSTNRRFGLPPEVGQFTLVTVSPEVGGGGGGQAAFAAADTSNSNLRHAGPAILEEIHAGDGVEIVGVIRAARERLSTTFEMRSASAGSRNARPT